MHEYTYDHTKTTRQIWAKLDTNIALQPGSTQESFYPDFRFLWHHYKCIAGRHAGTTHYFNAPTGLNIPGGDTAVVAGGVHGVARRVQRQAGDGLVVAHQHAPRRVRPGHVQVVDDARQGHRQQVLALPEARHLRVFSFQLELFFSIRNC